MKNILLFLFLSLSTSLFGEHYLEKAKLAYEKLNEFEIEEAFDAYSEIIASHDEEIDLNALYWIHRHRALTAFILEENEIAEEDLLKMEEILVTLGYPTESMNEFRRDIDTILPHILPLFEEPPIDRISYSGDFYAKPCGGIWHCIKRGGQYVKRSIKTATYNVQEAWYRATNNEDRLTKLMIEKRAKELYYPNLVTSKEEMEQRERELARLWDGLKDDTKAYLKENENKLGITGGSLLTLAGTAKAIKSPGGGLGFAGSLVIAAYTAKDLPDWSPIKQDLQHLLAEGGELVKREGENRDASYARCLERGVSPSVEFLPNQDSLWYDKYCSLDVDGHGVTFSFPVFIF